MYHKKRIILTLLLSIIGGLLILIFNFPDIEWLKNLLREVYYFVFFAMLLLLLFKKSSIYLISGIVLIFCCSVEVIQLIEGAWFRNIRKTLFGEIFIGSTFNPRDFISYFIGAIIVILIGKFYLNNTRRKIRQ